MTEDTITLHIPGHHLMGTLLGECDQHLRHIEDAFPETTVTVRGNEVHLSGPDAWAARTTFEELVLLAENGQRLDLNTARLDDRHGAS